MIVLFLFLIGSALAQNLDWYELRRDEATGRNKLVVQVSGMERNIETDVKRVWRGWHENILLYVKEAAGQRENLSYYNAVTGLRHLVTTEPAEIVDVTVAQLDAPHRPVVVLFRRDPETGIPGLVLADPDTGAFRRFERATAGAILNNTIAIRHFAADQFSPEKYPDLQKLKPTSVENVPLQAPGK